MKPRVLAQTAGGARYDAFGLAGAFAAISLCTLQSLTLTTRVYAFASAEAYLLALAIAALGTPLFYVALRGLADPAAPRPHPRIRLALAALAFGMALVATFDFDASLDRSAPRNLAYLVTAHRERATNIDRSYLGIWERLRPTTFVSAIGLGPVAPPFSLAGFDEFRVTAGETKLLLPIHKGLIGVPWFPAAGYRIEGARG